MSDLQMLMSFLNSNPHKPLPLPNTKPKAPGMDQAIAYGYDKKKKANAREIIKQQIADYLEGTQPAYDNALAGMSKERVPLANLARSMSGQELSYEKGLQGLVTQMEQRGGLLAANAKRKYEVDNPTAESTNKRLEYAKAYIGEENWDKLSDEERRLLMDDAFRQRQYLDTETSYVRDRDPSDVINKNLIAAGVDKKTAPVIADRLNGFAKDVNMAELFLLDMDKKIKDTAKLAGLTSYRTTGFGALLSAIPLDKANQWRQLRDTVVANIGVEELLRMKAESKTGASGFGQLNEKELQILLDLQGSLKQTNDPKEIKRILKQLEKRYNLMKDKYRRALRTDRDWYNKNKIYQPRNLWFEPHEDQMHLFEELEPGQPSYDDDDEIVDESPEARLQSLRDKYGKGGTQ